MVSSFSRWMQWKDRASCESIKWPGIYVIARSDDDISGKKFSFRKEIIYIGMTNSLRGLRGRLEQFDNTIAHIDHNTPQHGGADRVLFKHKNYARLAKKLYVALMIFEFCPSDKTPDSLRKKGHVAKAEYDCLAEFMEKMKCLPEFNRRESKKSSLSQV